MIIRAAIERDLPEILEIHNDAVKTLPAVWTDAEDSLDQRATWFHQRMELGYPVIVSESADGEVLGFGSYGRFREKSGYDLTVEHSVYVKKGARGQGAGRKMLLALINQAREDGFHAMVGAIDSENKASIVLHRKLGFEVSGILPQVGYKFGRWLDLTLVTMILDEASAPAATE
ncbi:N-acetyltransferase family protein [Rhodobacteraceae bacterium RKSG542]|uniref:GNAT family N-acetyltransferase n=1 Tax=Pseudovibrio flavus TaxID=2529854 RepID=UPI0012BD81BA|nr:GNAT family N-acetyltransferase [Pseudovibrio flavus]MTI17244.1 N-acetyltransferase family protein [Pseudovibrio flavus]